ASSSRSKLRDRGEGQVLRTQSMAANRSAGRIGLVRKSSMPAAKQRWRSSLRERAVKAMMGKCPPRARSRPPDCLTNLEAVQPRHVDIQEQQVDPPLSRQGERLAAVARQLHDVA